MSEREIDNVYLRRKFKNEKFGDKKSGIDDYTGENIFYGNKRTAVNKHSTSKTADVDHITPINTINERYKGLTNEQRKILANEKSNLVITSSKLNRSKQDFENHEYIIKQLKDGKPVALKTAGNMLVKEADSRVRMRICAMPMYMENGNEIGTTFLKGASDGLVNSANMIAAKGMDELLEVLDGDKDFDEAVKDTATVAITIAAVDGALSVVESLTGIDSNTIQLGANAFICIGDSAIKLANGEIDGNFVYQVTLVAGNYILYMVAPELIIAKKSIKLMTKTIKAVHKFYLKYKNADNMGKKASYMRRLEAEAVSAISEERELLIEINKREETEWLNSISEAFGNIISCAISNDAEGVAESLDGLLGNFGKTVKFHTRDEFNAFFNDENSVLQF